MNTMNNGNPMMNMIRKLSFLMDEAVWQFALCGVVVTGLVEAAMRTGGASIV
jgi:hypothetical protein